MRTLVAPLAVLLLVAIALVSSGSAQTPTTSYSTPTSLPPTTSTSSAYCPTSLPTGTTTSTTTEFPTASTTQLPTSATSGTTTSFPPTSTECPTTSTTTSSRRTTPATTGDDEERGTPGFLLPLAVLAFALLAVAIRRRTD